VRHCPRSGQLGGELLQRLLASRDQDDLVAVVGVAAGDGLAEARTDPADGDGLRHDRTSKT
jgi:hypothetical protein